MRHLTQTLAAFLLLISVSLSAQVVPNGGFENWSTNPQGGLYPDDWLAPYVLGDITNVLQAGGHTGQYAVELKAVNFPQFGTLAPTIVTMPFAVSQNYGSLSGYVKSDPMGNDSLYVLISMYTANNLMGVGAKQIGLPYSDWTAFDVPIYYTGPDLADSCIITVIAGNSQGTATEGTSFTLDDLSLSGSAGVNDISAVFGNIGDAYPSPARSSVTIPFSLSEQDAIELTVFDLQGRIVKKQAARQFNRGQHNIRLDVSSLSPGTYVYTLTPSDGTASSRTFIVE